ncbi:MAG TPA: glycosyltransferase [Patescibacteria group bacterium]|nr:glycosyltransferase [Patescibacteria group bacterium]
MKSFSLSVVIPSFNEMTNLRKGVLEKVERYLRRNKYDFEVIIVDDGSNDGSREFVKAFIKDNKEFKLIENQHTGKAGAVTAGMLASKGDYVLFTDMDQAVPIEELEKLLPFAYDGFDIVIGSRSGARRGAPLTRRVMSKGMMVLRSALVGLSNISDTQCGFKLFSKKAAHDIFGKLRELHNGYKAIKSSSVAAGFDVELLYIGSMLGYQIKEVSVDWLYVETRRVSPIKDSVDGILDLLRIKKNITKKAYQ